MMILAGCATKPTSGVVGWKSGTFSVGSYAPDIPFTSVDGKKTTFHKVRQPIAIVPFTSPPAEECCWVRPDLLSLTKRFKVLPVTLAQVSVPTSKCPHGAGCAEVCNLGIADLVSSCDADRKAWNAHGQPNPGKVILIDRNNKVAQIGNVEDLKALADRAEQIADAANDRRFGFEYWDYEYDVFC